jgi:hypothetical protein
LSSKSISFEELLLPSVQKRRKTIRSGIKLIAVMVASSENKENENRKLEQEKKAKSQSVRFD